MNKVDVDIIDGKTPTCLKIIMSANILVESVISIPPSFFIQLRPKYYFFNSSTSSHGTHELTSRYACFKYKKRSSGIRMNMLIKDTIFNLNEWKWMSNEGMSGKE